jgi:hypothetical protein
MIFWFLYVLKMNNLGTPYFKSLETSSEFEPELWTLKLLSARTKTRKIFQEQVEDPGL